MGRLAQRWFAKAGWDVVVLSRAGAGTMSPPGAAVDAGIGRHVVWDGATLGPWADELEGADVLLNLAGRTVNCRYNARNKAQIYASRLDSTRVLGEAVADCANPPTVWLNAATATIYRHAEDRPMDEVTGEIGTGFSVDVATKWERALADARTPSSVRKVAMRTAIVMARGDGGPFEVMLRLARRGLGGRMGSGRQMVSWIHGRDWLRAVMFLIEQDDLAGAVNLAAPGPLPNVEFMRELRRAAGVRVGLPAARWMLELGAILLRTETELVLKSRWVLPRRLLDAGFTFEYPTWPAAADALLAGNDALAPAALGHTTATSR